MENGKGRSRCKLCACHAGGLSRTDGAADGFRWLQPQTRFRMADGTLLECQATEQSFQLVWLTAAGHARLGMKCLLSNFVLYGLA